jgi:hypothetical protein
MSSITFSLTGRLCHWPRLASLLAKPPQRAALVRSSMVLPK